MIISFISTFSECMDLLLQRSIVMRSPCVGSHQHTTSASPFPTAPVLVQDQSRPHHVVPIPPPNHHLLPPLSTAHVRAADAAASLTLPSQVPAITGVIKSVSLSKACSCRYCDYCWRSCLGPSQPRRCLPGPTGSAPAQRAAAR